jgi:hypothetical protein
VPPPRKVFSLRDPVAYAATSLTDAALAIIAKYSACKWEMADGHTDYMQGAPAAEGQPVRAISDSGYGSSPGNAMEMLNWVNKEMGPAGSMEAPVMQMANGKKSTSHAANTWGFWCKKSESVPGIQANPRNRVPYNVGDAHFAIAAVSISGSGNTGVLFQASKAEDRQLAELAFVDGRPVARWADSAGQNVEVSSPAALSPNTPAVISMISAPGSQQLRVNAAVVGSNGTSFGSGVFTQMLIGWGFVGYYPQAAFGGNVYSVIAGKGAPTSDEMTVLEGYLRGTALA